MNVLLISFPFPPYNSIGGVRTGKLAKYLTRFGHDVRVISARSQDVPFRTLSVEVPADRVTYAPWINPRWLLERAVGRGRPAPWSDRQVVAGKSRARRTRRAVLRTIRSIVYFPDLYVGWLPFALRAAEQATRGWTPDLVYASASPVTGLLVASRLSRTHGWPWAADLRDLWVDNQHYEYVGWRRRLETRLERKVLGSASGLVTVSEPLAATLRSKFRAPVEVILNGFDGDDYPDATPSASDSLRIVYTGTIYPGHQSPAPLFAALKLLAEEASRIRVVFVGAPSSVVLEGAREYGVDASVEVTAPLPHHEALREQKQADILLHLLWNDPAQPGVYNAKIFEYFGAGRPILAVGYQGNVTADLVRERSAGVVSDEPQEIASALAGWLRQKRCGAGIAPLPDAARVGLSRREQARQLEAFFTRILEHASCVA